MTNLKGKLGRKIKKLRVGQGITQEQLADRAGISVDFLSLIERGRNAPSLKNLEKIAKALGVEVQKLFSKD